MKLLLTLVMVLLPVASAMAVEGTQPGADGTIRADVLYWDGEELVVKEMSGHERRLRVTPQTKIIGVVSRLKTGDKITAQVSPDGQAQSITLQIPDDMSFPAPPAAR